MPAPGSHVGSPAPAVRRRRWMLNRGQSDSLPGTNQRRFIQASLPARCSLRY